MHNLDVALGTERFGVGLLYGVVRFRDTPTYCALLALIALVSLGAAPKRKPIKPEPAPLFPVEPAWAFMLETPPSAAGGMDAKRVYIPLQTGQMIALDRETGDERWTTSAETRFSPLVAPGRVVVATDKGLRAVDTSDGDERWFTDLPGIAAPLAAEGGLLVATTSSGEAAAVRVGTGELVWRRPLGGVTRYAAAMLPNGPIAFSLDSQVVALDRETGEPLWTRALPGTLSPPAVARGLVLVGSTSNDFYALEAKNGAEAWNWRVGGDVIGAVADGEVVYFASLDNVLRAVNRSNGNQRWKTVVPTRPAAAPIAFNDIVVLAGVAPRVDSFLGKTGKAQGSHTATSEFEGAPLVDRPLKPFQVGMVTIARDGHVAALRPTGLMMRDPLPVPMLQLPGRRLERDRLDIAK